MNTLPSALRRLASLAAVCFIMALGSALFAQAIPISRGVQELGTATGSASQNLLKPPAPTVPTNYVLKPNDEIQVRVFRNADLDGPRRISKDGTIDFPLLGIVNVAGKTPYEAAAHLAKLLDKDYLVRPQVFINVAAVSKRYFDVAGPGITSQGTKEFPDDRELDILAALSIAGGLKPTGNDTNIMVKRQVGGEEKLFKVDTSRMVKERNVPRFYILPNDYIWVKERFL